VTRRWLRWAGTLRRLPERLLHPLRRQRARARLRRRLPGSILFVCHGNICRSPYAAAALRRLLPTGTRVRVDSAGFVGPFRSPPPEAIAVAASRGLDLARHQSKQLARELVRGADLVVVMEPGQAHALWTRFGRVPGRVLVLGDLDPLPIATRSIRDPIEQPWEVFEESYTRIDRCLSALILAIWA
jgi:protein-tyrosine phosphatase